ncbi:MAG: NUDIX pyrophosphatase [Candidatus Electryoneaceae bacterium]|nr:NUDIX pyrophosphatase [Candidatus Electryoneaceae bacterium]
MSRSPFQVLVLPFYLNSDAVRLYAVFKRIDFKTDCWQFIAGGGESNETPLETAKREAFEEGGIDPDSEYIPLGSMATIPVVNICGFQWGDDVLVIPEYCFGVNVLNPKLTISSEHSEYRWLPYEKAVGLLRWDSNKNGLWELDYRLGHRG